MNEIIFLWKNTLYINKIILTLKEYLIDYDQVYEDICFAGKHDYQMILQYKCDYIW